MQSRSWDESENRKRSFVEKPGEIQSIFRRKEEWKQDYFIIYLFIYRATPVAYGGSQARVKLELQLPAYTTATATLDPSHICNLHHSSRQCLILNPLSEAGDQTHILVGTSYICFRCTARGTPQDYFI